MANNVLVHLALKQGGLQIRPAPTARRHRRGARGARPVGVCVALLGDREHGRRPAAAAVRARDHTGRTASVILCDYPNFVTQSLAHERRARFTAVRTVGVKSSLRPTGRRVVITKCIIVGVVIITAGSDRAMMNAHAPHMCL